MAVYSTYADRIQINPAIMDGMPCIRGTRIPVQVILDYLAEGVTTEKILQEYPHLTLEDIRAALGFGSYVVGRWVSRDIADDSR